MGTSGHNGGDHKERKDNTMMQRAGFVCRLNRETGEPNGKTHVFTGNDTLCRMWSTGGLKQHKYGFFDSPPTRVCMNCRDMPEYDNLTYEDFLPKEEQLWLTDHH